MKVSKKGLLLASVMLATSAYAGPGNNPWEGLIKQVFKKGKYIRISSSKESNRVVPKVVSFRGTVQIPSYMDLVSGYGRMHVTAGQLIIDGQIVCNFSPKSNHPMFNRKFLFQNCSDGSSPRDEIHVQNKIELRLNQVQSESAVLSANVKVLESQQVEYGLILPYLKPSEGQILMFSGDAWIAADPSELDLQGLQGEPGPQGLQGEAGPMGPQGPKGDQGEPGVAGSAGAPGAAGPMGPMGPQGVAGSQGPKGDKGDPGMAGAAGVAGAMGPQGPQGLQGLKGDKGDAGVDGAAGPTGPQGPRGLDGTAGAAGPMGPQGVQGPKGDKGDQGIAGAQGDAGPQGPQGAAGPQGPKGDKGDRGLSEIAYLRDQRTSGVHGGTCQAAAGWQQRALNMIGGDNAFISLANNRFVLLPGKYFIEVQAPGYMNGFHQAKLKVLETNEDIMYGTTMVSHPTSPSVTLSVISGEIIVAATSTFEIQHRCSNDRMNVGFGQAANFGGAEVYTQVKIIKKQ